MTPARKIKILDAFLANIRYIGVRQIKAGIEAGDPLAQVRAACNVLEWIMDQPESKK